MVRTAEAKGCEDSANICKDCGTRRGQRWRMQIAKTVFVYAAAGWVSLRKRSGANGSLHKS